MLGFPSSLRARPHATCVHVMYNGERTRTGLINYISFSTTQSRVLGRLHAARIRHDLEKNITRAPVAQEYCTRWDQLSYISGHQDYVVFWFEDIVVGMDWPVAMITTGS
jgi:hypothetical protein